MLDVQLLRSHMHRLERKVVELARREEVRRDEASKPNANTVRAVAKAIFLVAHVAGGDVLGTFDKNWNWDVTFRKKWTRAAMAAMAAAPEPRRGLSRMPDSQAPYLDLPTAAKVLTEHGIPTSRPSIYQMIKLQGFPLLKIRGASTFRATPCSSGQGQRMKGFMPIYRTGKSARLLSVSWFAKQ